MYTVKSILHKTASTAITLTLCLSIYAIDAFSLDTPFEVAQSKSSGNEVMKEIENGRDFKGMTMDEVVDAIGEPWQKDTTPVKARYDQKWIYSCETDKGLTYDCVYIYFLGGRVVKADVL
jgi:hypothetical protein